jgi:hypothetical protein
MDDDQNLNQVEGSLNYLTSINERPVTYIHEPPAGTPPRSGEYAKFTVPIHNGRAILPELSLDKQGFVLTRQDTKVANFYDADEVRQVYYPEVEELVKQVTGAIKVLVFDHNVRNGAMAKQGFKGVQGPVKVAHNDYTENSGPQRVRDLLPDEADALLKNRFAVINVWRPIRGPVEEAPLAVCDARSIERQDFVKHELRYRDRTGEVFSLAFNPNHRWFYFPRMQKEEALLLKCFDSDAARARFSAHSAFADPTSPPDAAPRESIEARTLVFFAPD